MGNTGPRSCHPTAPPANAAITTATVPIKKCRETICSPSARLRLACRPSAAAGASEAQPAPRGVGGKADCVSSAGGGIMLGERSVGGKREEGGDEHDGSGAGNKEREGAGSNPVCRAPGIGPGSPLY